MGQMELHLGLTGSLSWTSAILARSDGTFVAAHVIRRPTRSRPKAPEETASDRSVLSLGIGSIHYREMPDSQIGYELRRLISGVATEAAKVLECSCNSVKASIRRIVVAVAGLDERFDRLKLDAYLFDLACQPGGELVIDVRGIGEACFCASFLGEPGIVVRAGVGCSVFGCNRRGEHHVTNAWGFIPGDLGGAYHIGMQVVHTLTRSHDKRADSEERDFASKVLAKLGSGMSVIDFFSEYCRTRPRDSIRNMKFAARLSNAAFELAAEPEEHPVAGRILDEASAQLASGIGAVVETLKLTGEETPIAFQGGTFARHPAYASRLFERARDSNGRLVFRGPQKSWDRTVGVGLLAVAPPSARGCIPWGNACQQLVDTLPGTGGDDSLRGLELSLY